MSQNLDMNAGRESDGRVLPAKCPNKGGSLSPAEGMEGRRPTKENTGQRAASQMQSWGNALAGLHRVREAARRDKRLRFTALLHHVSVALLANSFYALKRQAARADAERFLREWRDRLQKFGLELHPGKTRLIEFGRFAVRNRKQQGERKPETFNFLGFTHICGQSWKDGTFFVLRKTIRERLLAKLKQVKAALRVRMHQPLAEVGRWLKSVVQGYFNYHAVPGNFASLWRFRFEIRKRWLHVIRRRSQRSRMTWELLERLAVQWLPVPKILHPFTHLRFDAKHLR
jgi:hypothetical protein